MYFCAVAQHSECYVRNQLTIDWLIWVCTEQLNSDSFISSTAAGASASVDDMNETRIRPESPLDEAVHQTLRKINTGWYRQGIEKLVYRYKCLDLGGNYVEK